MKKLLKKRIDRALKLCYQQASMPMDKRAPTLPPSSKIFNSWREQAASVYFIWAQLDIGHAEHYAPLDASHPGGAQNRNAKNGCSRSTVRTSVGSCNKLESKRFRRRLQLPRQTLMHWAHPRSSYSPLLKLRELVGTPTKKSTQSGWKRALKA